MKKVLLCTLLLAGCAIAYAHSYTDAATPITWLGIDFSHLKFLKSDESTTEAALHDKYFNGWNDLIVQEKDKYDIGKYTGHDQVDYDLDAVNAVNAAAKGPFMVTDASGYTALTASDIDAMVKRYKLTKSGIGLVMIAEGFSKGNKEANMWVAYIDIGSKKVLKAVRVSKEPAGFGFRKYWAGAFYKVLKKFPI